MLKQSTMLSFDDVWLEPQYSTVESRSKPNLSSKLSNTVTLEHPVIASNMTSVVGPKMVKTLDQSGSIAFLHRFLNKEELIETYYAIRDQIKYFAFSIGVKEQDLDIAKAILTLAGEKAIVLVDIAHGHHSKLGQKVKELKAMGFHTVVAGNVATAEGFKYLQSCGADAIRVGVAGGKVCTTKYITGTHIPTLQSVIDCARVKTTASLIADGGIVHSGDAAKCLAAGADFVCLGNILAATSDSPTEMVKDEHGTMFKIYYGMSSKHAMDTYFPGQKNHVAPEGKITTIPYTGETINVLNEFLAGVKSALSYSGVTTIPEFQTKAILLYKGV